MATQNGSIATTLAALERARENCARLVLLVQEAMASPDQATIDSIVATATSNNLVPKPTYSLDGESYNWESYMESLLRQMDKMTDLINKLSAPWEIRSRGRA